MPGKVATAVREVLLREERRLDANCQLPTANCQLPMVDRSDVRFWGAEGLKHRRRMRNLRREEPLQ